MPLPHPRLTAVLVALASLASPAAAQDAPNPNDVKAVAVHPARVALNGTDDAAQLVVTGTLADGRLVDLTHVARYAVANATATVSATGRVQAKTDGAGEISIAFGAHTARLPVEARNVGVNLPLNFTNQVVPIFTKLGCNSGGCHGKASGQNGFRLSLLGFDPELDFMPRSLKEGRGRRLFPASPDASAVPAEGHRALSPHGGGKKMEPELRRVQGRAPLDRRRHAVGHRQGPDGRRRSACSPNTAS